MGSLGGRNANMECMQAIAALTGPPFTEAEGGAPNDAALAEAVQLSLYKAGGLRTMLEVAGSKSPPASAGAAAATVLHMFKNIGGPLRAQFVAGGGVAAMVRVLSNPYVELPHSACAAGCLWYFMAPDSRVRPDEGDAAVLKRTTDRIDAKARSRSAGNAVRLGERVWVGRMTPHCSVEQFRITF